MNFCMVLVSLFGFSDDVWCEGSSENNTGDFLIDFFRQQTDGITLPIGITAAVITMPIAADVVFLLHAARLRERFQSGQVRQRSCLPLNLLSVRSSENVETLFSDDPLANLPPPIRFSQSLPPRNLRPYLARRTNR